MGRCCLWVWVCAGVWDRSGAREDCREIIFIFFWVKECYCFQRKRRALLNSNLNYVDCVTIFLSAKVFNEPSSRSWLNCILTGQNEFLI